MENTPSTPKLKLLSDNVKLILEALDGQGIITQVKNVFKPYYDPDFKKWQLENPGLKTAEIITDVYEAIQTGTLAELFNSLPEDLDKLVLTQHQIIRFCQKYPKWLRGQGYGTNFLIKAHNEYYVIGVTRGSKNVLMAYVNRLKLEHPWLAEHHIRFVIPRISDSK